ncbi:SRPBCC family protein [Turneriella parva]|uniref:Activator of Hsp90 ATPase 1 family protein n=1 Tax=Turneriella parva (strain ATCC BAA-1111 / DSM 21527 / NCTC 11395 / H) TaxID=869212 RepID=I4B9U5_TURPD|nr:SRPBCC domain-containing protein [Turneriella parva]AFM14052.1 Activator of Hsp90 ATPase 1 family protein [Turneriella parva DSM 21527]AFM14099.1 Activator of Hsp90 ATPase 1 family protein [Turneriella parva DSM 21527]
MQPILIEVDISAPVEKIWAFLTQPALMQKWMSPPKAEITVQTDWQIGNEIIISVFHDHYFQNKGQVIAFNPPRLLEYSHLSSLSNLPAESENFTYLRFVIEGARNGGRLALKISNFPTESVYQHMQFYWRGAIQILKSHIEISRQASYPEKERRKPF